MSECKNLCEAFVSKNTCRYCRDNYEVSEDFYTAKRFSDSNYVTGYLVRSKLTEEIQGILNKSNHFAELAYIDENTLQKVKLMANSNG